MTGRILFNVVPWFVTLLLLQAPVFAHHKGWHKNGPTEDALHHYKHAKKNKHHHNHGDHDGHGKGREHQHEHNDRNSVVNLDLPADPQILKPEVCVKGICLSAK